MADKWEGIEEIVAIADCGSFVGAARKLSLSPSHISRAVSRIEARIGERLFERTTRSVRLTDAGIRAVEGCRRLIEDRDETLALVQFNREMMGQLRITCSVALGQYFLEPLLREFLVAYPGVSIWLELTNRLVDIVGESFDIAIRTGSPSDDRLAGREVTARTLMVAASPDYLARRGIPQHPRDLIDHECLVGTSPTWQFLIDGKRATIVPSGRWRCNNGPSIVAAALSGLGLCQLPSFYIDAHLASGELVSLLDEFRHEPEPIWIMYQERRLQVARVERLVEFLAARLAGAIGPAPMPGKPSPD